MRCQKRDPHSILVCGNVKRFSDGSNPPFFSGKIVFCTATYMLYSYVSRISQRRKQTTKLSYGHIVCNLQLLTVLRNWRRFSRRKPSYLLVSLFLALRSHLEQRKIDSKSLTFLIIYRRKNVPQEYLINNIILLT